jgi:hypothetical protein
VDANGAAISVGAVGVGGFSSGGGVNSTPASSGWSGQACAAVYAGGCAQGGGTPSGHPDPIWMGGGPTFGTGVFVGPKYTWTVG